MKKRITCLAIALFLLIAFLPQAYAAETYSVVQNSAWRTEGFSDGLFLVCNKATDLYGYADQTGNLVLPCAYETATLFYDGIAVVKANGETVFIDHAGKTLAPYVVVDLSSGPDGEHFPIRYSLTGPDISDDACRTTELWLRLIPPGTPLLQKGNDVPQGRRKGFQGKPEQMEFPCRPAYVYLNTGNKGNSLPECLLLGLQQAAAGIMIGQGQDGKARRCRLPDKISGGITAVGRRRMCM